MTFEIRTIKLLPEPKHADLTRQSGLSGLHASLDRQGEQRGTRFRIQL